MLLSTEVALILVPPHLSPILPILLKTIVYIDIKSRDLQNTLRVVLKGI